MDENAHCVWYFTCRVNVLGKYLTFTEWCRRWNTSFATESPKARNTITHFWPLRQSWCSMSPIFDSNLCAWGFPDWIRIYIYHSVDHLFSRCGTIEFWMKQASWQEIQVSHSQRPSKKKHHHKHWENAPGQRVEEWLYVIYSWTLLPDCTSIYQSKLARNACWWPWILACLRFTRMTSIQTFAVHMTRWICTISSIRENFIRCIKRWDIHCISGISSMQTLRLCILMSLNTAGRLNFSIVNQCVATISACIIHLSAVRWGKVMYEGDRCTYWR